MPANLALERSGEEDQEFNGILSYRELGIWYTGECLKNKAKNNQTTKKTQKQQKKQTPHFIPPICNSVSLTLEIQTGSCEYTMIKV